MKKLLVGAVCAIASLPGFAEDWTFIGVTPHTADYVDTSSRVKNGNVVSAWQMTVLKKVEEKISYLLMWRESDCSQHKTRVTEVIAYDSEGYQLAKRSDGEWERPAPGSSTKRLSDRICKNELPKHFEDMSPYIVALLTRDALKKNGTWK